jgi:polysaccharide biosynthesis protein PslH
VPTLRTPDFELSAASTAASTGTALRIAIVDEELPYPANSGKRIRSLNLVLRLARRHHLTYIAHRHADAKEAAEAAAFFRERGIEVLLADRAVPRKSGLGFYARLGANLCSSLPYSVQSHTSMGMQRLIRASQTTRPVDLWHCEWTPYAENLSRAVPEAPFIVMAHNIESQIWRRYVDHEPNRCKRWYIRRQWSKFEQFERRVFAAASATVFVSRTDAELAQSQFGTSRAEVVENGVDLEHFHPADVEREKATLLFLGSLDWRPNLDAVTILLDRIFPQVSRHLSAARLWLVGRNPPPWLRDRVRRESRVELHENVPDVRPFLWRCSVLAVPLRIGGGSRLKILEATACQCPVVSTGIGAEGLDLVPDRHYRRADAPEAMAESLRECLASPEESRAMSQSGRDLVLQKYSWDSLSKKLERVWHQQVARQREAAAA